MRRLKLDSMIATRVYNTPLLIEETKADTIRRYVEFRMGMRDEADAYEKEDDEHMEATVQKGVAVIPVVGTLVHRGGYMDAESGLLSYEHLREQIQMAAEDGKVGAILLDIDSPGGEVEGNFELARYVRMINDEIKPVAAIANGMAFSGGYSLLVAAGQAFVTETGGVGSVGVIMQHADYSKWNEKNGITVTNITYGKRKAEFSPDFPLTKEARQTLQAEVDRLGEMFVDHVAQMREISPSVVRKTEAGLIFGAEAVKIGFVDGVTTFDALLQNLIAAMGDAEQTPQNKGLHSMFTRKPKASVEQEAPKSEGDAPAEQPTPAENDGEEEVAEGSNDPAPAEDNNESADIAQACVDAGFPEMSVEFLRNKMTLEQVNKRMAEAKQIKQLCKLAGKEDRAKQFIASGESLAKVQDTLVSEMADDSHLEKEPSSKPDPKAAQEDFTATDNLLMKDVERRKAAAEKLKTK